MAAGTLPARIFHLPTAAGARLCLCHLPAAAPRGAILYLHPFAEEMNKSRRMAALQARRFAAAGFAVLQVDLAGCGDSDGDLRDVRWDTWMADVAAAAAWLRGAAPGPLWLWGLRLGALLALDAARRLPVPVEGCLLWQPVTDGALHLNQFLRLKLAGAAMQEDGADAAGNGVTALRARLQQGETIEVGGYPIAPALADDLSRLRLADLAMPGPRIAWCEVVPQAARGWPPAARRVLDAWQRRGIAASAHLVEGLPFWTTAEIAECPALLALGDVLVERVPA